MLIEDANLSLPLQALARVAATWEQFSYQTSPSLSSYTQHLQHRCSLVHSTYHDFLTSSLQEFPQQTHAPACPPTAPVPHQPTFQQTSPLPHHPLTPQPQQPTFQYPGPPVHNSTTPTTTTSYLHQTVHLEQNPQPDPHLTSAQPALSVPLHTQPAPAPHQPPAEPTTDNDLVGAQIIQHPDWKQLLTDSHRHAIIRFISSKLHSTFIYSPFPGSVLSVPHSPILCPTNLLSA